jgi:hypothetical protein
MSSFTKIKIVCAALLLPSLMACSNGNDNNNREQTPQLEVGAASRSLLPTVSGGRDYLQSAPGWPAASELDPNDPGVFIPVWDQGRIDVGNGNSWASWVHDDIRATAVALERGQERVVIVTSNTYMHLKADVDVMVERARAVLPDEWQDAEILIASTHNHHGPETAFGPNGDWYDMAADQIVAAVVDAVGSLEPASASIATGEHDYGSVDQRDPRVYDNRLNVMGFNSNETGESIAIVVQWNSHPEVTLGWEPPADAAGLDEVCPIRGWEGGDCTAEDRYFTGDYVGVLETRLKAAHGGEVAFFNGALGVLTGPLHASAWVVDDEHPVGDGKTVPDGAIPLTECDDSNPYECQSFAKTESTGNELASAVNALLANAEPMAVESINIRKEEFYSRVTNLGFRVLMAEGELGWKPMQAYNCTGKPFTDENCTFAGDEIIEDPVVALLGYSVAKGDVLKTRVIHVDFGDVGMLFLPGEVSSELVIGLPDDFTTAPPEKYNQHPDEHSVGADYTIPGHYLSLVDESITFTIGLGTDEVGYFVPPSDYRLQCLDLVLAVAAPGSSCQDLAARGLIESPTWVGGITCQKVTDDAEYRESLGADGVAVKAVCYYGQMVGAEIEKPPGHYEETNSAGWDLVDDLWAATVKLFEGS